VQGANRLASNSVTEAIIAGRRTGTAIADALARADRPGGLGAHKVREFRSDVPRGHNEPGVYRDAVADRYALAQAMSRYAGVMRDGDGLARLLAVIAESGAPCALGPAAGLGGAGLGGAGLGDAGCADAGEVGGLDLESVEAANLRAVSVLIAVGARRRAESRGCHRRLDAAGTDGTPWHTLARWDGQKLLVTKEEL
jgi:L-aspartate oxidase